MAGHTEQRTSLGEPDEKDAKSDLDDRQIRSLLKRPNLFFSSAALIALATGIADKTFALDVKENRSATLRTGPEGRVELAWSLDETTVAIIRYDVAGHEVVAITQAQKADSRNIVVKYEFNGDIITTEVAPQESGAGLDVLSFNFEGDWRDVSKRMRKEMGRNNVQHENLEAATSILSGALVNPYQPVDSEQLAQEFLRGLVD